jgi:hypothetical protein
MPLMLQELERDLSTGEWPQPPPHQQGGVDLLTLGSGGNGAKAHTSASAVPTTVYGSSVACGAPPSLGTFWFSDKLRVLLRTILSVGGDGGGGNTQSQGNGLTAAHAGTVWTARPACDAARSCTLQPPSTMVFFDEKVRVLGGCPHPL